MLLRKKESQRKRNPTKASHRYFIVFTDDCGTVVLCELCDSKVIYHEHVYMNIEDIKMINGLVSSNLLYYITVSC